MVSSEVVPETGPARDGAPVVVLLHGMLGSAAYWQELTSHLPDCRVVALDLLGFGASPRPPRCAYDYRDHVDAVIASLDAVAPGAPVVLVGHSMGALIALRLAAELPGRVRRLVLVGMPVFETPAAARRAIAPTRVRRVLLYGPVSWVFCHVWCRLLRPLSRRVAPIYARRVPVAVARASVDHSWRSYSRSLANVVEKQAVEADLRAVRCPVLVVHGDQDRDASGPGDWSLPAAVRVLTLEGDHHLPLRRPAELATLIRMEPT